MDTKNNNGEQDVLAKIDKTSEKYRETAKQLHELIMATTPSLQPRLWYGMPGYALKANGPVVLFFHVEKYISFGLTDSTNLSKLGDPEQGMVEVAWYLTKLDDETRTMVASIVRNVTA